jgi:hypothetical protein
MQTTVTYSEALIRRAIFRYWMRFIKWHGFAAIAVWSPLCIGVIVRQAEAWLVCCVLVSAVLTVACLLGAYVAYLHRALSKFRRMGGPTAEVTISGGEFHVKTTLADSRLQWRAITGIWRFPETWMVFVGTSDFMTLPIDAISMEDRELMCARVRQHGGRVV